MMDKFNHIKKKTVIKGKLNGKKKLLRFYLFKLGLLLASSAASAALARSTGKTLEGRPRVPGSILLITVIFSSSLAEALRQALTWIVALAQCHSDPLLQGSTKQLEHLRLRGSNIESIECIYVYVFSQ